MQDLKKICRTSVLFVGPLIPLCLTSGDVCPWLQSQDGPSLACFLAYMQWIPQIHLAFSWLALQSNLFDAHTCAHTYIGGTWIQDWVCGTVYTLTVWAILAWLCVRMLTSRLFEQIFSWGHHSNWMRLFYSTRLHFTCDCSWERLIVVYASAEWVLVTTRVCG